MSALSWPSKDPDEKLDYIIDWSNRLPESDAIAQSAWDVPSGLTKHQDDFGPAATTVWLSGGTDGETYTITNTVTSTEGRILQESVRLKVRSR